MKKLDLLTGVTLRKDIPDFQIGDTVSIGVKIVEGGKEKVQEFKGVVLARKGGGAGETFIVRKISFGEGVERSFYINSPMIKFLKIIKRGKVRRAKLYYLRGKIGKKAKLKERGIADVLSPATEESNKEVTNEKAGEVPDKE